MREENHQDPIFHMRSLSHVDSMRKGTDGKVRVVLGCCVSSWVRPEQSNGLVATSSAPHYRLDAVLEDAVGFSGK